MSVTEIHALPDVRFEIEEEIHCIAVIEILPFALPNRALLAIRAVHPPVKRSLLSRLPGEQREKIDTVEGFFARRGDTGNREEGGMQIHRDSHLRRRLALRQL